MAQYSVSAAKPAAKGGGKLESVTITFADNGFMVRKSYAPKSSSRGPVWEPDPKPAVFTEPGAMLTYVEKCVGEREHKAHEKAEGQT